MFPTWKPARANRSGLSGWGLHVVLEQFMVFFRPQSQRDLAIRQGRAH